MSRPLRVRALVPLVLLAAAGCQDYNFNPVGHCLVQPGTERFTLSDVSTADVLFVVDDSGSMGGEQVKLAQAFGRFIQNLDETNAARAANQLDPIDFHLAVTTTSVFWNFEVGQTCRSDCPGAAGSLVCCGGSGTFVAKGPKACGSNADCGGLGAGVTCSTSCNRLKGESYCCNGAGVPPLVANVTCTREGAQCGFLETHYDFQGCGVSVTTNGVAVNQWPYPRGDFVSWSSATAANPRVLHFDKQLYPATPDPAAKNRQGFTRQQLVEWFAGSANVVNGTMGVGGNVVAGVCGSGQEQPLQAAKLALEKALSRRQKDTYSLAGQLTWNPETRVASSDAEWPHEKSKLVLVFIGDEDDCSSPQDPSGGVVMVNAATGSPADACVADATRAPAEQKQIQVDQFVEYFTGLGRSVAAAFIFPAAQTACSGTGGVRGGEPLPVCTPGFCADPICTDGPSQCGAQAAGHRLVMAANALRAKRAGDQPVDVVMGSICDPQFDELLDEVAEIVKPPPGLSLPTRPAEGKITLLRIAQTNGQTRKNCTGPAPAGTTGDALNAYDWWFTEARETREPVTVSTFVYINHSTGNCEANPGETYSADYIALNPPASDANPNGGCTTRQSCQRALGGQEEDWGCYQVPGTSTGTCICCSPGSTEPACQVP